jgi:murein L,D-transpeptidase YafK
MKPRRIVLGAAIIAAVLSAASVALDLARAGRPPPDMAPEAEWADRILVEKSQRRMTLFRNGSVLREYSISLGGSPTGDKERGGDSRTPTGRYVVDFKNETSRFYLSLRISYPDAADREQAAARGVPPGGDIMIHGLPNGFALLGPVLGLMDWTDGCIAVGNDEIEEIWSLAAVGTAIEIME